MLIPACCPDMYMLDEPSNETRSKRQASTVTLVPSAECEADVFDP